LAKSLDAALFEVHFACNSDNWPLLKNLKARLWPITSIPGERFIQSLAAGSPIYDAKTLKAYVDEDLGLLKTIQPDLVIGDFRLSLAISCPLYGVPYATVTNAYWSPFSILKHYPLPEIPITRFFGVPLATKIFHLIQPLVFAHHARPVNKARRIFGLPQLGNLMHVYTHASYVLYADIPGLFPTEALPANHHFLGPIFWSPEVELPHWWSGLDAQKSLVYVNLGSSGAIHVLPSLLAALKDLPITIVLATAGRWTTKSLPSNVLISDYLPGEQVVTRSNLVICNGGSPSVYQALRGRVPVLGIASNMDQHLMMQAVVREHAGLLIRSDEATVENLRKAVLLLLENESYRHGAERLERVIAQHPAQNKFTAFAKSVLFKSIQG
jgi:UDP:flavonoid glycosyltransferase YjiC (YdhE family)